MARVLAGLLPIVLVACGPAVAAPERSPSGTVSEPDGTAAVPPGGYPVGVRILPADDRHRPVPVTVWYPARQDGPQAPVAAGRFPVVLFSHGLHSLPAHHVELTTRWAAAGFVVAAPTYPHTNLHATRFTRADVRHQPGDGWQVLRRLHRLTATRDPLADHLDLRRVAAAGHSAGGFTTAGMFTAGRPRSLRGGIVIAGGGLPGTFAGPPAHLLFVHGDADPVVPVEVGRAAYRRAAWPKAFLTLSGQGHGEYLTPGKPGFAQVIATTTDFLRWILRDDRAARDRIPDGAALAGVSQLSRTW